MSGSGARAWVERGIASSHLDGAVFMHQDVAALDVSMDDAGLVQETQAQKNLSRVTGDDALREGTKSFEHVRHAAARHPFLEYVDHPFCLVDSGANVAHDVDVAKLTHELNLVGQCVDGVTLPGDVQLLDGEEFSLEIWGMGWEGKGRGQG